MPSPLPVLLLSFIFLLNKDRSRASGIISPPFFFFLEVQRLTFITKENGVQQYAEKDQIRQGKIISFLGKSKRLQKGD